MYFNIVITMNDVIFFLSMVPLLMVFSVMFKDWKNDRH
jgi:hypothetical protein